jgi:hypothetical protein
MGSHGPATNKDCLIKIKIIMPPPHKSSKIALQTSVKSQDPSQFPKQPRWRFSADIVEQSHERQLS